MLGSRNFSTVWNNTPILVTSRFISRYAWTSASIDVSVDGAVILRTGGVFRVTGTVVQTFTSRGANHEAKLTWGRGSLRWFPFKLEIDGALVAEAKVPTSNWWCAYWPFTATIALIFLWRLLT